MDEGVSKKTKRSMLITAGALLLVAVIWLILLESNSYVRNVCGRINKFGYHVSPASFYMQVYGSNTSLDELIDEDIDLLCSLSSTAGFGADVSKKGLVELMLWNMDDQNIMYVWLVDREPELVFIENCITHEVQPIGEI